MSDVVTIGDCTLHHGDCLAVLGTLDANSIDAVITDPPYSSGGMYRGDRVKDINDKYVQGGAAIKYPMFSGDNMDQRQFYRFSVEWMTLAFGAAKLKSYLLSFIDWRQLPVLTDAIAAAGWVWSGVNVWDKGAGSRSGSVSHFRSQCEFIPWATKGGTAGSRTNGSDRSGPWAGCYRVSAVSSAKREHQSEKPVELLADLAKVTNEGEVVLDPFMGSGTTGVACARLGRKFIGIEKDRLHFETACRRIKEEYARTAIVTEAVA